MKPPKELSQKEKFIEFLMLSMAIGMILFSYLKILFL